MYYIGAYNILYGQYALVVLLARKTEGTTKKKPNKWN